MFNFLDMHLFCLVTLLLPVHFTLLFFLLISVWTYCIYTVQLLSFLRLQLDTIDLL